jgi:monofunctional biosynthetic peptidoglycan transglycosylase
VPAAQLGAEQSARLAAYLPNPKRYGRVRSGPYLDKRTADIARYMADAIVP